MIESMRRFVDWVAAYSMSAPGAVLRMAMSIPEALTPGRPRIVYRLAEMFPDYRETSARTRVVDVLRDGPARGATDLAREAAVGAGVVRTLAGIGVLDAVEVYDEAPLPQPISIQVLFISGSNHLRNSLPTILVQTPIHRSYASGLLNFILFIKSL